MQKEKCYSIIAKVSKKDGPLLRNTGVYGSIFQQIVSREVFSTFGLQNPRHTNKNPIAKGVAFGTAAHVIGTAKANELSPLSGAVSSLSLVIAGLMTAVLFPLLLSF